MRQGCDGSGGRGAKGFRGRLCEDWSVVSSTVQPVLRGKQFLASGTVARKVEMGEGEGEGGREQAL